MLGLKGGDNPWSLRSDAVRSVSVLEADAHHLVVRSTDLDGNELDVFQLKRKTGTASQRPGVGAGRRHPRQVGP